MVSVSQLTGLCPAHLLYRQERWRGGRGLSCGPSCQLSDLRVYQRPGRVQGGGMGAATGHHIGGVRLWSQSQQLSLELRGDPGAQRQERWVESRGVGSVTGGQLCPGHMPLLTGHRAGLCPWCRVCCSNRCFSSASLFPFLHFGEGDCFSWLMNTDYDPFLPAMDWRQGGAQGRSLCSPRADRGGEL